MFHSTRSIRPMSTISIQLSQNWKYRSQMVTGPWQGFKELEISFEQSISHEQITPSFSRGGEGIKTPLWSEHAGGVVGRTAEDRSSAVVRANAATSALYSGKSARAHGRVDAAGWEGNSAGWWAFMRHASICWWCPQRLEFSSALSTSPINLHFNIVFVISVITHKHCYEKLGVILLIFVTVFLFGRYCVRFSLLNSTILATAFHDFSRCH